MEREEKYYDSDEELVSLSEKIDALRENGVDCIASLRHENFVLKHNRLLSPEERERCIAENNVKIEVAKEIARKNKPEVDALVKKALHRNKIVGTEYIKRIRGDQKELIRMLRAGHAKKVAAIKADKSLGELERKEAVFDLGNKLISTVDKARDVIDQAFIDYVQKNCTIRNSGRNILESIVLAVQHFLNGFHLSQFLLSNGLYLAILFFFIVCIIIAPISGNGNLLTLGNIFSILEQASVRVFYALGVAALILLAGTDLSVGRMVALGAIVTGVILHQGPNVLTFFGASPWDFSSLPIVVRLLMALFLSIALCVLFSVFSGVFTAKLKIHPFISTLATQLIIYGLLFFSTNGTPVGTIDGRIKDLIGGRWVLGSFGGDLVTVPKLIVPAIIAVVVAWFIWNKTVFGKNMFAVGGNAEAASVSGINVFRVTVGVFIMAGIFYGVGAFLETFRANANAGTGQGYELDAIAACVVGGISFNGGIGKISGAVAGVIIFTGLTYCLSFLGIDTNLQFVFKGIIIITAVALDRVKYIRRK